MTKKIKTERKFKPSNPNNMVRTNMYLRRDQRALLKRLGKAGGKSAATHMRRAIDLYLRSLFGLEEYEEDEEYNEWF